jgi:hypothetical protein
VTGGNEASISIAAAPPIGQQRSLVILKWMILKGCERNFSNDFYAASLSEYFRFLMARIAGWRGRSVAALRHTALPPFGGRID